VSEREEDLTVSQEGVIMKTARIVLAIAIAVGTIASGAALADRGHGHSRVVFGINLGVPLGPWYYPPYYYPIRPGVGCHLIPTSLRHRRRRRSTSNGVWILRPVGAVIRLLVLLPRSAGVSPLRHGMSHRLADSAAAIARTPGPR